jgi:23S rRNA (cytidine1920-2'-O)/16S rRNA (cytidine1409-2'-O)-methyltransferase
MPESKERIDLLLVEQGFYDSREKAKAAVMAGLVFLNGNRLEKAGMKVPKSSAFSIKGQIHPYVSRGGLKLERAIHHFHLQLEGIVMIDIGSSTGGFTDCALQHGASYIYAIDVGTNQLDWRLRTHPHVCVMEKFNFRYVKPTDLKGPKPNFAATDVSFISLKLIFPPLLTLLMPGDQFVALIKPQFEAGRDAVGKSGVVKDDKLHREILLNLIKFAESIGIVLEGLTYSPITGSEGNIEFLSLWSLGAGPMLNDCDPNSRHYELVAKTVDEAHKVLYS